MADVTQKIQILVDYVIKNQQKVDAMTVGLRKQGGQFGDVTRKVVSGAMKQQQALDVLARKQRFYATWSDKLGVNTSRVNQIMSSQGMIFGKLGEITDHAGRSVKNLTSKMNAGRASTQRFQMEWLGVMFFGMAINRMFGQYVKGTLDMLGVNNLLTEGLKYMVLTALTPFLDNIINLAAGFYNLPEAIQKALGWFLILGAVLGGGLFILGQTALGVISIGTAWDKHKGKFRTVFSQAGYASVMGKMTKLARFAAGGAALWLIYQGIKDAKDNQIKAMGELLVAAGLSRYMITGKFGKLGKIGIGIGAALILFGDEELLIRVIKIMYKVGNAISSIVKEAMMAGFTLREFDITKVKGFADFGRAFRIAAEELSLEEEDIMPMMPIESIRKITEEITKLQKQIEFGGLVVKEDAARQIEALEEQRKVLERTYDFAKVVHEEWKKEVEEIGKAWETVPKEYETRYIIRGLTGGIGKMGGIADILGKIVAPKYFQQGGVVPGPIGAPVPAIVHGGERVIPINQVGSERNISLNVVYNIEVADRDALESMFREHDIKLVEEVKRAIAI